MESSFNKIPIIALVLASTALSHSHAQGKPNLRSLTPSAWSSPIVGSKVTGTRTDSSPLLNTDKLYVDGAVLNDGTTATTLRYFITLSLDGQLVRSWFVDPSHHPNFFVSVDDFELGPLSPGTHTLQLIVDSSSVVDESNESDNSFTKTVIVTQPTPNLRPYQPSGWSAPVVVSKQQSTNQDDDPLYESDILLVDWAVINDGSGPTDSEYVVTLYVDGIEQSTWSTDPPHDASFYISIEDFSLGSLAAGTHTVKVVADSSAQISESSESDNTFTKIIIIEKGTPNLIHYQPPGWSNPLVVSNKKSTHTDSSLLISTDTLFVDWAVSNIGTGATEQRYSVKLLLDDKEVTSWFIEPPHTPNFYSFVEDLELHSLSAGTHILTLIADSTSEIAESNETNNVFTKKIRVDVSPEGEQEITIVFPKVQKDAAFDTGVAIANPTASVAEVNLLLIDEKGNLITGPEITNPVTLSIPANNQVARTVQEFFGKEVRRLGSCLQSKSRDRWIFPLFFRRCLED